MTTANNLASLGNSPAFSAYASAQTISATTFTNIQLANKVFDTATAFNNTGSTVTLNGLSVPAYAFCPPVAGYYQLNGAFSFASGVNGVTTVCIYKNGSNFVNGQQLNTPLYVLTVNGLVYLNGTGDYVQLYAYSPSTITSTPAASNSYFNGSMVRGA